MAKNLSLYNNLVKNYGKRKADSIYAAMEQEGKKATSKQAIRKSKKHHPEYYKKGNVKTSSTKGRTKKNIKKKG